MTVMVPDLLLPTELERERALVLASLKDVAPLLRA
jgi:hypothetical protein